VGQHAQQALAGLSVIAGGPHRRAQEALVLAEGALDLPPLAVDAPVEPPGHLRPIMPRGRCTGPALVDGNNRGTNPKLLSAQSMVMLGVVGCVGQKALKPQVPCGLTHGLRELGRIVARTAREHRPCQKVRCGMADYGELRPVLAAFEPSAAAQVVKAALVCLQACGVNGSFGPLIDQAPASSSGESSRKERQESPFFSRRFSA